MKKLLITFAALIAMNSANAEWTQTGQYASNGGVVSLSADYSTIRVTALNRFTVWAVMNNTKPSVGFYPSYIENLSIDCEIHGYATNALTAYSGEYGSGNAMQLVTVPQTKFELIVPGTIMSSLQEKTCAYYTLFNK